MIAVVLGLITATILVLPGYEPSELRDLLLARPQLRQDLFLALLLVAWGFLFHAFRLYSRRNLADLRTSFWVIVIANAIGTALVIGIVVWAGLGVAKFSFAMILWGTATICGITPRVIAAVLFKRRAGNPRNWSSFLIVGTNQRSRRLAESLSSDFVRPRKFIGFVDFGGYKSETEDESAPDIFLDLEDLPEYLRNSHVDDVIVCLPLKSYYDETIRIIACCEEQGIRVHVLADLFETRMTHSRVRYFADQPLITVASHEMYGVPALAKRAMDILGATALLVLLSPIYAATALAVSLSSHGPVFFSQERVGLNKKRFLVHKFRTMITDAEYRQGALEAVNEANGPAFKIRKDPRVTTVGKFLRKFSIDELPQLINVLRGEMSLVGPRPLPLRDYAGFDKDWHRRRLSVRPGITGLWQVTDRHHGSFERWMRLDMQYIDQWSIWLDLKILALTIPAVFRGSGS